MATAADTFTWALHEAPLKAWLEIADTTEDIWLEQWLAAAALDCDACCGWYYTDEDDEIIDHTPADPSADALITQGVYEWVRAMRDSRSMPVGLKSARTGAISETFAGSGSAGLQPLKIARAHAEAYWQNSVYNPLHTGKGYSA